MIGGQGVEVSKTLFYMEKSLKSVFFQNFFCFVRIVADAQNGVRTGAFNDGGIQPGHLFRRIAGVQIGLIGYPVFKQLFHLFGLGSLLGLNDRYLAGGSAGA